MLFTGFTHLETSLIDGQPALFDVSAGEIGSASHFLPGAGLLRPLWVQATPTGRYRLVSGLERYRAAQAAGLERVPALIIDRQRTDLELYRLCIEDARAEQALSPLAVSIVLHKLTDFFQLSKEAVVHTYLPAMGLGENAALFDLYYPLSEMEMEAQKALLQEIISVEVAAALIPLARQDRMALLDLIETLRLSKSSQREFINLLCDLSRIEATSIQGLLEDPAIAGLIRQPKQTPSQKQEKLKQEIIRRRYPCYGATAAAFSRILQEAKLPPAIQLRPTPYFADDYFHVQMQFRSLEEYQDLMATLQRLGTTGLIARMALLT